MPGKLDFIAKDRLIREYDFLAMKCIAMSAVVSSYSTLDGL